MFKLGVKTINGTDYVYAQESTYMSREKTDTKSYSLGNVKKFIANLNTQLWNGTVYTYSGEACLSKIAGKIKFRECVNKHIPKKWKYDLPSYLLTLAVYQILNPDSKSQLKEWYQNSYIQHVVKLPEIAFHKNNIYDYMDKFYKKRHKIFQSLRDAAISAIKIHVSELIFDTTSVSFRVAEFTVEDRFRRRGHSSNKRPDLLQIIVAVCTNSDGFPLYYRAYPGNTSTFHAFKNFLHDFDTEIKPVHKGGIIWVIFDKGNTSKKTIQRLDKISERHLFNLSLEYKQYLKAGETDEELKKAFGDNKISLHSNTKVFKIKESMWMINDGKILYRMEENDNHLSIYSENTADGYLVYIAAIKLNKDMLDELEHAKPCLVDDREYKVAEMFTETYNGVKRVLAVYDPKLKDKQVVKLEKKYTRVKSELDKILQNESDRIKCISKMSKVIQDSRMTTVFKIKEDDEKLGYMENKSAKKKMLMKARTFAILTNNFTASREDLITRYLGRNRIEQTIREIKSLIDIRPVYHHLKRRIKTHVFVVMTGYLLLSATKIYLQKKGASITMEKLQSILRTGYVEIIEWKESVTIEYPKNVSENLEKIYEKFDIALLKV